MNRFISSAVCATAVLLSSVSIDAVTAAASAQADVSLSFDTFHDQLAPYGDWVYSDRWGEVWIPENVSQDFHPYGTNGHWVYTDDYGWTWESAYEWGDIPFHYGRWVNDPDDGWLWIPGYVWSPGWVVWRSNGQYTGWMPMPPDDAFLGGSFDVGGVGISLDFNNTGDYYGYARWYGGRFDENAFAANWVFVGTGHLADNDYRRFEAPRGNYTVLIRNTRNITNYTVVNNFVVNKSVDVHIVERAGGRPITPVAATAVFRKPQFVMRADVGRQVQMQMRQQIPRGNGTAGSAAKPSTKIVQSLSPNAPRNGRQPMHIFTRDTVTKAPLANGPGAQPQNGTPAGGMTGPRATDQTDHRHIDTNNGGTPANTPPREPGAGESHVQPPSNGTSPPASDETGRKHHPADMNPQNPTTTPPGETSPSTPGMMGPPADHRDRVVTPPAGTTPPPNGNETPHKDRVQQTPPPGSPPPDDKKKDKKPKPDETPPPQ